MNSLFTKLTVLVVFASLVIIPTFALAGGLTGTHYIQKVRQRECQPNKGVEITFADAHNNPDGCASNQIIELSCDMTTYKANLAIILSAFSTGQAVEMWVSGCDSEGQAILKSVSVYSE
jgi:hypothetical protein